MPTVHQMFQYFPRSISVSTSSHLYLLRKTLVAAIMSLTFQVSDPMCEETKYPIWGQTAINFKFKPRPGYRILVTIPASWRGVWYMSRLSSKSINYFKITIRRMLPFSTEGFTCWHQLGTPRTSQRCLRNEWKALRLEWCHVDVPH